MILIEIENMFVVSLIVDWNHIIIYIVDTGKILFLLHEKKH